MLRYAFSLVGRRAVAEEIVQEAFLQLHKRWSEVDSPKAWLVRCVRNKAFNYLRDNKREVLGSEDMIVHEKQASEASPETMLLTLEALGVLRTALQELDAVDRQLGNLKYFQNLRYIDISAKTGLSVSNVGYRLHHILKELASKLRPLGIDEQS